MEYLSRLKAYMDDSFLHQRVSDKLWRISDEQFLKSTSVHKLKKKRSARKELQQAKHGSKTISKKSANISHKFYSHG